MARYGWALMSCRSVSILVLFCVLGWPLLARAEPAFWVWNRATHLSQAERDDLKKAGIGTLYWHFAEIENTDGEWRWKRAPKLPEKSSETLRIVPVIRLEASVRDPFADAATEVLTAKLTTAFRAVDAGEWQLDYDAPDRLVGDYARFLQRLHVEAPKLTSTALAGWVRLPAFGALQDSVAELFPMFYDLEPDTAAALRPLIEADSTKALMAEWDVKCRIPWRVGLPWFARLTVYGVDGRSHGHFRQWMWDDVVFRRELHVTRATQDGVTTLQVEAPLALGKSVLRPGDMLVARWPDLAALREVARITKRDAIFFRLPDEAASSGWSLREFGARDEAPAASPPRITLRMDHDRLVLRNEGAHDLPPRIVGDGPQDRGYALEVDAPAAMFREALPGEFWRIAGHVQPDSKKPRAVPIVAATRLTLWFSALPAGRELRSGLLQLSPGAASSALRCRVLNAEPDPVWRPLDSSR